MPAAELEPMMGRVIEPEPGRRVDGRVAILQFGVDHALDFRTRSTVYKTVDPDTVTGRPLGWVIPCTPEQNERWTEAAVACVVELDRAALALHEARRRAAQPPPRKRALAEEMQRDWADAQSRYRSRFQAATDAYSPVIREVGDAIRRQLDVDLRRLHAQRQAEKVEEQRIQAVVEQRLGELADELRWGIKVSHSPGRTLHVVCVGVAPRAVPEDAAPLVEDVDVRTLRESLVERGWADVVFDDSIQEHIRAHFADLPGLSRHTGLWDFWWKLFTEDYKTGRVPTGSSRQTYGSSHTSYTGFHF
ncbi:hypothetical protein GCM10009609_73110 [Pseudonocardia aurantiaca]|uniref:Uncharacterized protein n=1 Tax=Pseudonocardia aurantiaca TaxID=75290 RepID=A0ABW4FJ61_9PSEU